MSTSGSIDFSVTRNDIIKVAYQRVGVVREGGTPASTHYTEGALLLNILCKAWHGNVNIGMPLWAVKTGYILPVSDTNSITLTSSGGHATHSYTHTQLGAAAAAGATSLTVDSITGISASDYIGVEQSNGSIHWTTVSGAPSGTTVVLASGLASAAAVDGEVYAYTSKIGSPIRLLSAYTRDSDSIDLEMELIGREDYFGIPDKTVESRPNQIYYDPQLSAGVAYVWPRFEDGTNVIVFNYHRAFEDFDSSTDTPDFPQAWYRALTWALAYELAPMYGMEINERRQLKSDMLLAIEEAKESDTEYTSLKIQPDWNDNSA